MSLDARYSIVSTRNDNDIVGKQYPVITGRHPLNKFDIKNNNVSWLVNSFDVSFNTFVKRDERSLSFLDVAVVVFF